MWMELAKWVQSGGALPNIPELVRELTAPTYTYCGGKFQLEDKGQIKNRLGFSPDLGDALALTFALPERSKTESYPGFDSTKQLKSEWEPFDDSRV